MTTFGPGEHPQSSALDGALAELLDLGLLSNHARWNITGPQFHTTRLALEGLADLARNGADRVAERAVTLGHAPDGRAVAIATRSSLPTIEPGAMRDGVAMSAFATILETVVGRLHLAMDAFETDPVTRELLTALLAMTERYAWMLRAHGS